jgi:hypothetical protein
VQAGLHAVLKSVGDDWRGEEVRVDVLNMRRLPCVVTAMAADGGDGEPGVTLEPARGLTLRLVEEWWEPTVWWGSPPAPEAAQETALTAKVPVTQTNGGWASIKPKPGDGDASLFNQMGMSMSAVTLQMADTMGASAQSARGYTGTLGRGGYMKAPAEPRYVLRCEEPERPPLSSAMGPGHAASIVANEANAQGVELESLQISVQIMETNVKPRLVRRPLDLTKKRSMLDDDDDDDDDGGGGGGGHGGGGGFSSDGENEDDEEPLGEDDEVEVNLGRLYGGDEQWHPGVILLARNNGHFDVEANLCCAKSRSPDLWQPRDEALRATRTARQLEQDDAEAGKDDGIGLVSSLINVLVARQRRAMAQAALAAVSQGPAALAAAGAGASEKDGIHSDVGADTVTAL